MQDGNARAEGETSAGAEERGEAHDGGIRDAQVGPRGLGQRDLTLRHPRHLPLARPQTTGPWALQDKVFIALDNYFSAISWRCWLVTIQPILLLPIKK